MSSLSKNLRLSGVRILSLMLALLSLCVVAQAQEGVSSASASRTRYMAESGLLPPPSEVAVEEFVNYYRHRLSTPKAGEAVAMDTRWGNDVVSAQQPEAVLQVGFTTSAVSDRTALRPLNLALVIDRSGSMAAEDKMSRVKQSLLTMVSQLRPSDVISIIVFDSSAQVLLPAQKINDGAAIRKAISSIEPGGSTNLHSGLMLGYKEARKNLNTEATNRVILLTDGIANTGVTDPQQIVRESLTFNDDGIDLSTIGVGLDLDKELLNKLAKGGRGLFHFVADAQDIEKVFVKELQSLVSPVARRVQVEINYDPGLELEQLYGYEPQHSSNRINLKLDDMNQGLTEVVMMRFKVKQARAARQRLPVRVRLSYYDLERKAEVVHEDEAVLSVGGSSGDMLKDQEVRKNYTVAVLAQALYDMAVAWENKNYQKAEVIAGAALGKAYERYPNLEDKDILYTLSILQKYQESISKHNRQLRDAALR
ncbi:MAG: Ca-activated chloride channel [Blastocatellia bacterium]|jgi:Mg-chelatase subunit ChlD|nr:Ca-activated chloride channel [Blastocatellia bacterium]